jgi:hypothetical protein
MLNAQLRRHLVEAVADYETNTQNARHSDLSDIGSPQVMRLTTRLQHAIERVAGRESIFGLQVQRVLDGDDAACIKMMLLYGIAQALTTDIQQGFLKTAEEMIHGDVFTDFLERADYLLGEGHKDAAAVIAGSTLEGHLRQLCIKHGVDATVDGANPKKADLINADLVKAAAYEKTDLKNVTAWLAIRNDAAHGEYGKYQPGQVQVMISGIRDFITRVPA